MPWKIGCKNLVEHWNQRWSKCPKCFISGRKRPRCIAPRFSQTSLTRHRCFNTWKTIHMAFALYRQFTWRDTGRHAKALLDMIQMNRDSSSSTDLFSLVMLSAAKHLCVPRERPFAVLRMTSEGSSQADNGETLSPCQSMTGKYSSVMLSAAKHLVTCRARPFAECTLSGTNVLRVTLCMHMHSMMWT